MMCPPKVSALVQLSGGGTICNNPTFSFDSMSIVGVNPKKEKRRKEQAMAIKLSLVFVDKCFLMRKDM